MFTGLVRPTITPSDLTVDVALARRRETVIAVRNTFMLSLSVPASLLATVFDTYFNSSSSSSVVDPGEGTGGTGTPLFFRK